MSTRVRVIGCGNLNAGDDALGVVAVEELRLRLGDAPDVEFVRAGPALALLDLLDGVEVAFVVDAVRTADGRRVAGSLVRVEAGPDGFPVDLRPSLSSHGFGVGESVGLAGALGRTPRVVFLGIEAADVTVGSGLSPPVRRSLPSLLDRLETEIRGLTSVVPAE